jgi:peptide chain release factor subunit 3
VFIGHVDAGKSTLSGQILLLTGMVDQRTIEKYEREAKENARDSWFLAYVMDCGEDEREKGITIEVGRASFATKAKRYTILDAPGHRNFVPNMITGASQADVAVLVVSARINEFEAGFHRGGQTTEHAILAKTLGIDTLIVVVNKMDDESVMWSQERYENIKRELGSFLRKIGYTEVKFVPVSGYTGINVMSRMNKQTCHWYDGPSLLETLDSLPLIQRNTEGPLRVPILDKYKDERGQTAIIGKIEQGSITKGQKVVIMPNRVECEVVRLVSNDQDVDIVLAGENAFIYVSGEDSNVHAGHVMCDQRDPLEASCAFVGQFKVLDKDVLTAGYEAQMHIHTALINCSVKSILATVDPRTGRDLIVKPTIARKGDLIRAIFELGKPICFEKFDVLPSMGRFAMREDRNIGVGKVLLKKKN